MINISQLKIRDEIQVRDIGKATIINIDSKGDSNPYSRTAVQIELPNKRQLWIMPEKILNKKEDKNYFPQVVNGELGVKPNTWSKSPIVERKKSMIKRITKQQLQEMVRKEAKRQLNEVKLDIDVIILSISKIIKNMKDEYSSTRDIGKDNYNNLLSNVKELKRFLKY